MVNTSPDPGIPSFPVDKSLVLDDLDEKFRAFQAFRKSDVSATEAILSALGAQDDVEPVAPRRQGQHQTEGGNGEWPQMRYSCPQPLQRFPTARTHFDGEDSPGCTRYSNPYPQLALFFWV